MPQQRAMHSPVNFEISVDLTDAHKQETLGTVTMFVKFLASQSAAVCSNVALPPINVVDLVAIATHFASAFDTSSNITIV